MPKRARKRIPEEGNKEKLKTYRAEITRLRKRIRQLEEELKTAKCTKTPEDKVDRDFKHDDQQRAAFVRRLKRMAELTRKKQSS